MQREDQTDGVPASIVTSPENQPVRNSDAERFGCPIKTGQSRGSLSLRRQRQSEKSRINASVAIKWPIAGNAYNEKHTIRSTQPRARRLQASSRNTIELGPDGNSYRRTYDFSELNGMQLNGQTVSIDLVFSTQVHLFRNSLDFLIFFTFLTSDGESFITGTGYVTNALGNPMTATDGRLWSASTTDTMFVGLSPCDFGLERPSDIYGTHFDLTLPDIDASILDGTLLLYDFELISHGGAVSDRSVCAGQRPNRFAAGRRACAVCCVWCANTVAPRRR